jgi:tRNA-Thr(GGU) m(6)t(6)A37 methyltransferase TsaA
MALTLTLDAVGVVRNGITDLADRDWGAVESEILIDAALVGGLAGIERYLDLVVVFYLHKFSFDPATDLQQPTSARDDTPVGIFALRTHQRPNSIGATTVRLLNVEGRVLRVRGLDALDGSPVLDIKPHQPSVIRKTLPLPRIDPEI